jgi:hypothetical protein
MTAIAIVFVTLFVVAILVVALSLRRQIRRNDELVAAGSFGRQFFGRREKREKPQDWLK